MIIFECTRQRTPYSIEGLFRCLIIEVTQGDDGVFSDVAGRVCSQAICGQCSSCVM